MLHQQLIQCILPNRLGKKRRGKKRKYLSVLHEANSFCFSFFFFSIVYVSRSGSNLQQDPFFLPLLLFRYSLAFFFSLIGFLSSDLLFFFFFSFFVFFFSLSLAMDALHVMFT